MNNSKTNQDFVYSFFKDNWFGLIGKIAALLVLLAQLWITLQTAPFREDIKLVQAKVIELEKKQEKADIIQDRFIVTEEKTKNIESIVKEIQSDVRTILIRTKQ